MDIDALRSKIQNRIFVDPRLLDVMLHVIERYEASVNIKNLVTGDLVLFDNKNRRVGFSPCKTLKAGVYSLEYLKDDVDVVVVVYDGSILGWTSASDVHNLMFESSSLNPLPEEFDFRIQCSHLSEHGGYTTDYNRWVCLGCGKELVFSDKKR